MRFYDYTESKKYCESLGLYWMDDFVTEIDTLAYDYAFSQDQLDVALKSHLTQVKYMFTPKNYSFKGRILIAIYFLFGVKPK